MKTYSINKTFKVQVRKTKSNSNYNHFITLHHVDDPPDTAIMGTTIKQQDATEAKALEWGRQELDKYLHHPEKYGIVYI